MRPKVWTGQKKAQAQSHICAELAAGRSLRKICEEDDVAPSHAIVNKWLADEPEFLARYVRAREEQADHYADEIIQIADLESDPNKARVRVDARKWVAAKLKPQKYSDRVYHEGTIIHKMSDDQLDARVAQLLGKAGADRAARGADTSESET